MTFTVSSSDFAPIITALAGLLTAVVAFVTSIVILIKQNKKAEQDHIETIRAINERSGQP